LGNRRLPNCRTLLLPPKKGNQTSKHQCKRPDPHLGDEVIVRTTEYWYLRWWSAVEQKYRYPYRETNRHTYILIRTAEGWLVDENIQPAPRSCTPHRQRK
jgi:hypothetical protein